MRIHGGDRRARLDFSSNINPLAPPKYVYNIISECIDKRVLEKYPDYNYEELRSAISKFYECDSENIIPTAGAHEAINLTILALKPKKIIVLEPSYGEYEDLSGVLNIDYIPLYYKRLEEGFYLDVTQLNAFCQDREALIVITNPNNPTGSYIDRSQLLDSLSQCKAKILVDEAYMELCTHCPITVKNVTSENFIIVRSLTKWLGLPGMRLGFLYVTSRSVIDKINILRQPWNINSLTECLVTELFNKFSNELYSFIRASKEFIYRERERVSIALKEMGIKVYESVTNFLLIEVREGLKLVSVLKENGIAVRSCLSFKGLGPNFIRIAIRKTEENDELLKVLKEVIGCEQGHR
ncbi:MAG: histidinol-phosphate aminotransferase family protein [Desulfurococcaceae archaeon]|nr:histidinol-phosphate aminotransferase family protein [Desulfurococcaceae archaeon]